MHRPLQNVLRASVTLVTAMASWLALASSLSAADARWSPQSTILDDGATLPAERCGDLFFVEVEINGAPPLWMLLDTGSQVTVLDAAVAGRVPGVRRRDQTAASDSSGRRSSIEEWVHVESALVGALELREFDIAVFDLSRLRDALGRSVDGMLGFSAFADVLLTLSYRDGSVHVSRGALATPNRTDVFTYYDATRPQIPLQIDRRTVYALVDSGATPAISVESIEQYKTREAPAQVGRSVGVAGRSAVRAARLTGDGRVGRFQLRSPILRSSSRGSRVGAAFLRDFEVTFDARRRRLRLTREDGDFIECPSLRGLGVAFDIDGDGWLVSECYGGDEGPLLLGDRILRVGDCPALEFGCERLLYFDDRPHVDLTLRRGEEELRMTVPVRTLVR